MLKVEDRLAYQHAGGEVKQTKYGWAKYWSPASKYKLVERLGEYEDLGYTPEELREMIEKGGWVDDGK